MTPSGYYWSVVYTTGNSNSATTFNTVYSSPGGPLTRDCTIVTNGSNMLRVYLDGVLVYSSSSLSLNMPSPFNTYLEVESSYSPSFLWGEYRNYYAASGEMVTLKSAPPGDVAKVIDSSGGVLASSLVDSTGMAALDIGQFQQPVDGSVQVYDNSGALLDSTQSPGPIWGGDVYEVSSGSYGGPTPPSAPTGLDANAVSASQINLSWTAPSTDGGSPITGYTIQRSSDGGSSWSTIVPSTSSASTTYSDTGLSAAQTYTYLVEALSSVGSSPPSNTASSTTYPPSNSTITVNTVNSQNQAIQGYYIALFRNGVQTGSCFSWCSFTVTSGATYQVAAESYGAETFNHWSDGTTGDPRTVNVPATST
ncbi:MAG TPA: fibronectin type III domain-containing protein, partial [Nitrososphaerales archaeon]|nr:fibronectin type III domain-containing protein [Nitrososphaerales archaeon]